MANTPFELYEEAYRLHYREKLIPDAVKIYETLMREFPDSSECGYAFIQLQKIKANEITERLQAGGGTWNPMILVAAFAGYTALIIAIAGILIAFHELRMEHNRTTLAVATLAKMQAGNQNEASKILTEMKRRYPNDILAHELSSFVAAGVPEMNRKSDPSLSETDASSRISAPVAENAVSAAPVKKNNPARIARTVARSPSLRSDSHAALLEAAPTSAAPADSADH
jgi:hypothetical protein